MSQYRQKNMKYVIFQTKWGYFGLAGTESCLWRTQLPVKKPETIKSLFLKEFSDAHLDKNLFKNLQKQVIDYFEGKKVHFNTDISVFLDGFTEFQRHILHACRNITLGRIVTYADLAQKTGHLNAGRAVGNTLAKNPVPLIIPCHRVIRSDGKLGGFSAPGGTNLKKRFLMHEKHIL